MANRTIGVKLFPYVNRIRKIWRFFSPMLWKWQIIINIYTICHVMNQSESVNNGKWLSLEIDLWNWEISSPSPLLLHSFSTSSSLLLSKIRKEFKGMTRWIFLRELLSGFIERMLTDTTLLTKPRHPSKSLQSSFHPGVNWVSP